ncbi:DegV family protein [Legionella erythra]|uniref:Lipoprotein n=1 Tax=Legionella erythra TaxID=448 RepID=A0A0W0TSI9_LEGER|nr:DegV family protein [Legionella erythra]KTC98569.1 lipoprotein [Legionella erythra]
MALLHLDAGLLHSAIIHACYTLIQQRESLNAINLFPVADGDTGDNMAATARAIVTHAKPMADMEATCRAIADAGILGARGNSGMIFSQFFNGLLDTTMPPELDTRYFAAMVSRAATSVRAAIVNPVEGTILTVMEAWAKALERAATQTSCFNQLMIDTQPALEEALQTTATTLTVLKEAHVVDAGALGFRLFVKGFAEFLANPLQKYEPIDLLRCESHHDEQPVSGHPPVTRYCTEAMLVGEGIDKGAITQAVQDKGDSIVLTANSRICRLHLHCNKPWQVFSSLQSLGKVQYPKVDDMLRQYEIIHQRKYPIALVTDTCANIPQDVADHYQIHFITINVHFDGHDLLDRYCLDGENFYDHLTRSVVYPTTSFPAPALIEEKLRHLSDHYEHVLVISVAKALSGTHDAIVKAGQPFTNVHVINSRHVAGSQGLLLNHAAELIADGHSIEAIKESLQDKIAKTKIFVMVNQFDSLIRSGRISKLKGMLAQFSGVKPIISLDEEGKGMIHDKAFSETKALSKLVALIQEQANDKGLDNYCIIHAGVPEKAQEFALMTTEAFGYEPAFIEPASTAIGLHAGKGSVALAAILN